MSTKQNAPMAVILAGGEGKRLRPLTATTPKPLLPVLGKPLLCHILKRLETAKMLTVRSEEYGGRLRKYYRITKEGIARIEEFKREWEQIVSIYSFVVKEGEVND